MVGNLLVIVGPTAVGKTALAVQLAADFEVEILSADSRQIYRGMDIGTAKPTPQEQATAPHHFIDVVDPAETLTLAQFQEQAYAIINACHKAENLPVLVGGTGQWVKAVVEGWNIPHVPPDPILRAELETKATETGYQALHAELAVVDPQAAQKIDPRNARRIIRALEVFHHTKIPISQHQKKKPPPYRILQIGLTMARELLYGRIDRRIERMMEGGLLEEVNALVERGYSWQSPAMSGLGYKQIGQYLRAETSLDEAVALIKKETRRFVRQQYNWFRLNDNQIRWFDISEGLEKKYEAIKTLIEMELI
jgi:tRNA dimethylallyltransferase